MQTLTRIFLLGAMLGGSLLYGAGFVVAGQVLPAVLAGAGTGLFLMAGLILMLVYTDNL